MFIEEENNYQLGIISKISFFFYHILNLTPSLKSGKKPELPFRSSRFLLVLFSSVFGSLILFQLIILVLQVLSG